VKHSTWRESSAVASDLVVPGRRCRNDHARRFSASDGRWSSVKDAAHRSADEMAKVWLRDFEQARRECEEVLKRERHREVERALGQLANSRAGRTELRKKLDDMLALIARSPSGSAVRTGHGTRSSDACSRPPIACEATGRTSTAPRSPHAPTSRLARTIRMPRRRSTRCSATRARRARRIVELRAEYNRWDAEVDKLRDWSKQDVEEIRQAFCRAPDAGEYEEVYAVADRWAVQLNDQWGSINGQGNRIKARTQELINKGRAPKNGPKVIAAVDTILTSIAKIKEYQLKGSNNPLLKARAEFGVDEHNQRQRGCQAKEVLISSSYCDNPHPKRKDCKIDCVKVSSKTCTIIEIKPKDAERLGRNQVAAYALAISKMFAQRGTSEFTDRLGVFRECVSEDGKTLALERAVELYDFCPSTSQLGETPAEVNITIPEEEE
jgi:hypothetical protein